MLPFPKAVAAVIGTYAGGGFNTHWQEFAFWTLCDSIWSFTRRLCPIAVNCHV